MTKGQFEVALAIGMTTYNNDLLLVRSDVQNTINGVSPKSSIKYDEKTETVEFECNGKTEKIGIDKVLYIAYKNEDNK